MFEILRKISVKYHLLYWAVYFGINNFLYYFEGYKYFFLSTFLYNLSLIIIFYVTLIFTSYSFRTNKYILSVSMILSAYALSSYVSKWLLENTSLYAPIYPEEKNLSIFTMFYDYFSEYMENTVWPIIFVIFIHQKEKNQEEKLILIERQKISLESSKIKNNYIEINNTFNIILELSKKHFKELHEDLIEINSLFNYYANMTFFQLVTIEEEIKNALYFINVNQKRHHNIYKIKPIINISDKDMLIPNMLVLTLLENAFKHGDLTKHDLLLNINAENKKVSIFIKNKNKSKNKNKTESTNLGIFNLKRRLEILFAGKFSYDIKSDNKFYQTELNLYN